MQITRRDAIKRAAADVCLEAVRVTGQANERTGAISTAIRRRYAEWETAAIATTAVAPVMASLREICITSHLRVMARWESAGGMLYASAAIGGPLPGS